MKKDWKYGRWIAAILVILIILWMVVRTEGELNNLGYYLSENRSDADAGGGEDILKKGYNLPIDKDEKEKASEECLKAMRSVQELYKDSRENVDISGSLFDETLEQMKTTLGKSGDCVVVSNVYPEGMQNYEKMESFLKQALEGEACEETVFEIYPSGNISRKKFSFDGENLYLLSCIGIWQENDNPGISDISYARVREWNYTEKGWFCYEVCVPEPPEVTEVVDGNTMLRVRPVKEEYREIGETWIWPIGYQGNNLLCSEWNENSMEKLDYNGLYEYLYVIEYQKKMDSGKYMEGIAKEEFESLMIKYLPVSAEQLQRNAVYDPDGQTYGWERLGCGNYILNAFRTSVPEVAGMSENADGTVTVTVDAVCEMLRSDRVFSHELTVRFTESGVEYLGNHILDDGKENIPVYHNRID